MTFVLAPINMLIVVEISGFQTRVRIGKLFLYFSCKTYVVGTQKNRLNETILLGTLDICFNKWVRK